ncbi:CidA/LrgA family protein [Mannheimia sp. AT1]|uniref:CidA/LrgA family protein n=1 Tax=Mannheimia cairinae TaxID=3025936 RepID=A0ABT5MQX9_9PAST|nr:CidA/LrgA family protein [Mannheimia cairinae]MDD0824590.1 CidA/LrgA family protein [Mannheimia cairinae]MDD0826481.1 CidA/LrgA family protein [Mannheimia cairinae]
MLLKAIRIVLSLALLFGMLYLGKLMAFLVPIGMPDSIWGMLLLFSCLVIGVIKVEWITPGARPLTRYMTIFFLPICAELIEHLDLLRHNLDTFVLSTILSTTVSLVAIGLFAQWLFHRNRG